MKTTHKLHLIAALASSKLGTGLHLPFRPAVTCKLLPSPPSAPSAWALALRTTRRSFGAALASGAGAFVAAPRVSWGVAMATAPVVERPAARRLPPDCDQAVTHLVDRATGRELYLVGTAHISNVSAVLVDATIRAVNPSLIAVELDASRTRGLATPTQPLVAYNGRIVQGSTAPGSLAAGSQQPPPNTARKGPFGLPALRLGFSLDQLGPAVIGKAIQQMYRSMDQAGFQSGNEFKVAIEAGARLQVSSARF